VTVAQAADLTGAQPRTIRRWISRGRLAVRSGPHGRLVELGAVERLVAERLDGDPGIVGILTGPDRIGPDYDHGQGRTAIRNGPDGETLPQTEESLPQGKVSAEGFGELVALLREKDQTILELAGRCGFLQARVQELERENLLLRAPVPQSETLASQTTDHLPTKQKGHDSDAEQPVRRTWWRFWV